MIRLVAAGASGFLGTALLDEARRRGYEVLQLVRRAPRGPDERRWDPDAGELDLDDLRGADAVVNLCGVPMNHRWSDSYRQLIRTSRIVPTQVLSRGCVEAQVPLLLNASAVGYYGPRGDEVVDETALAGRTFAAGVCADWESATVAAVEGGVRVVNLRTGLVIGDGGGLMVPVKLVTKLFLGGRLGSGKQYYPWISLTDWVAAVLFAVTADQLSGPVNLTAPNPVTNREFMSDVGRALRRPTPWMVPTFGLKAVLGDFAEEIVNGQRAVPAKLEDAGFVFSHATLPEALRAELR